MVSDDDKRKCGADTAIGKVLRPFTPEMVCRDYLKRCKDFCNAEGIAFKVSVIYLTVFKATTTELSDVFGEDPVLQLDWKVPAEVIEFPKGGAQ